MNFQNKSSVITQESQRFELDSNQTGNVVWNFNFLLREWYRH